MKKSLLLFILITFLNCQSIAKLSYGVKDPEFKENKELNQFLQKNKLQATTYFKFKDFDNMLKAFKLKFSSIPDAYFFDKNGNYIPYKNSAEECNAKVDDFIYDLEKKNYKIDSSKNINQLIDLLTSDKNESIVQNEITVLITWATFMGKVNKEKAFEWVKLLDLAKSKGIKVNYYLVNYDLQKSWNLSKSEEKEVTNSFKI